MSGTLSPYTTNVPPATFGAKGFVAPPESAVLAGALQDINTAFGGNLNVDTNNLNTPQGQIASSETAIIGDQNSLFCELANGVDPAYAEGRMQDAIARFYFLTRIPASSTVVQVLCSGAVNTAIPVNAMLKSPVDGNTYLCTSGGTIPSGGSVTLAFACAVTGPFAAPAQTWQIYQTVPGWDSAVSSAAGTPGINVESRNAFEARRAASVSLNATGTPDSIRAAVLQIPGVLGCFVLNNPSPVAVTQYGVTIAAKSVYVSVLGGTAAAVATAIWQKISMGCGTNGTTAVQVSDPAYAAPQPEYTVNFQIPTQTQVYFTVTLQNTGIVPADASILIQNAILSVFAGAGSAAPATIGSTVLASAFYAAVQAIGPWVSLLSIQVGIAASPTTFSVALPISQIPTVAAGNIALALV